MSIAFLFPGQGSQKPGLLHSLPNHPVVVRCLMEAATVLEQDALLLDTTEALRSTYAIQVSLLIAGVASMRALRDLGATPALVAGHSVGAFAAAVAAGSLAFDDALRLVALRAKAMAAACTEGYGMAAIIGLTEAEVQRLLARWDRTAPGLYLAVINAPRQVVVSGRRDHLAMFMRLASTSGAQKTTLLAIPVPAHCVLMEEASTALRDAFASVAIRDADVTYVRNRDARPTVSAAAIRDDLIGGPESPVRWHDSMEILVELGANLVVELPPGCVLSDLARASFQNLRSVAMAEQSLHAVADMVKGMRSGPSEWRRI